LPLSFEFISKTVKDRGNPSTSYCSINSRKKEKEHHIKRNLEIANSGQLPRKLIAKIINFKTEYLDDSIS
jgi:hypothetical protein